MNITTLHVIVRMNMREVNAKLVSHHLLVCSELNCNLINSKFFASTRKQITFTKLQFPYFCVLEIKCELECQNDGICAKDHNGNAECFCPQGWSGRQCENSRKIDLYMILAKCTK